MSGQLAEETDEIDGPEHHQDERDDDRRRVLARAVALDQQIGVVGDDHRAPWCGWRRSRPAPASGAPPGRAESMRPPGTPEGDTSSSLTSIVWRASRISTSWPDFRWRPAPPAPWREGTSPRRSSAARGSGVDESGPESGAAAAAFALIDPSVRTTSPPREVSAPRALSSVDEPVARQARSSPDRARPRRRRSSPARRAQRCHRWCRPATAGSRGGVPRSARARASGAKKCVAATCVEK